MGITHPHFVSWIALMSGRFEIPFVSKNGIRGAVISSSPTLNDDPEQSVVFETSRLAVVGRQYLRPAQDGSYLLDLTVDPRPPDTPLAQKITSTQENTDDIVIPRVEETLTVSRHLTETARVRVNKSVVSRQATAEDSIVYEEYSIQRVPIDREVSEVTPTRVEGDVTIIPVFEEQLVTVKRLVLREEIHLVKKRREERQPHNVVLRKEEVTVDRFPSTSK